MPRATIGIVTYRRNASLRKLLVRLTSEPGANGARIFVADNACDPATEELVDEIRAGFPDIEYHAVAARGISNNRNAILDRFSHASDGGEFLAMLDDDLLPTQGWLNLMLDAGTRYDADIVGGPYWIEIANPTPLVANSILMRRRTADSGPIDIFHAGGNCLLRRTFLESNPSLRFDRDLGLSGGEDYDFFTRAKRLGAKFAWCAEALCIEEAPAKRLTAGYILHRYYSTGNSMAFIDMKRVSRAAVAASMARSGLKSSAVAALALLRLDRDRMMRALLDVAWACGGLSGALQGRLIERYR